MADDSEGGPVFRLVYGSHLRIPAHQLKEDSVLDAMRDHVRGAQPA